MTNKDLQNLIDKINEDFKKRDLRFLIISCGSRGGFIKFMCAIETNYKNDDYMFIRLIDIKPQYLDLNYNLLFELITLKLKKKQYHIMKKLEVEYDKYRKRI